MLFDFLPSPLSPGAIVLCTILGAFSSLCLGVFPVLLGIRLIRHLFNT